MKSWLRLAIAGLAVTALAIQLIPVERTNPPNDGEVPASPEVRSILRRTCYDCHSNETVWRWYSRIAPVSWLVAHDVDEGREALNFTAWNALEPGKQAKLIRESWEEVSEGEMPPALYLPMHPDATLTAADRKLLREWAESASH
jgi:hypothetical protein